MDIQHNSELATSSLLKTASRTGMKPILLVLGISGLAILGAGAIKDWQPMEVVSGAVVQKVFAAIGAPQNQPAQSTPESSHAVVSVPDVPVATLVERSSIPAASTIAERPKTVSTARDALAGGLFAVAVECRELRALKAAAVHPHSPSGLTRSAVAIAARRSAN